MLFKKDQAVKDLIKDFNRICSILEDNKSVLVEENSLRHEQKIKTVYIATLTITLNRIYRVLLAYLNQRLKMIKNEFWESNGDSQKINEYMSKNEREFFMAYKNMITEYQDSFPIDLNMLTDLEPPKDIHIEIRVLQNCGEVFTNDGQILKLEKNSTLLVRRCDVEHLLRQNVIVQTK